MSGKRRRNLIIPAAAVILVAAAAAGICLYLNRFDPEAYVQAVLDVSYKKQTEEYEEITGVPEDEAEAVFEENLDAAMAEFESSPMPEELRPQYRELFGEIAMQVSYTVGETQKEEGGSYAVQVMVKPLTLFADTYDAFQQRAEVLPVSGERLWKRWQKIIRMLLWNICWWTTVRCSWFVIRHSLM